MSDHISLLPSEGVTHTAPGVLVLQEVQLRGCLETFVVLEIGGDAI